MYVKTKTYRLHTWVVPKATARHFTEPLAKKQLIESQYHICWSLTRLSVPPVGSCEVYFNPCHTYITLEYLLLMGENLL